ncbi:glycosyltransferase family 4 protein [Priestia megaterium]
MGNALIIGPLPPPIHGESVAIKELLDSAEIQKAYNMTLVNTNRKDITNTGGFSLIKIIEDLKHFLKVSYYTLFKTQDLVYISISQTKLGLFRDALFLLVSSLKSKRLVTHLHGNNLGNVIDNLSFLEYRLISYSLKKVDVGIVLGESLKENYKGLVNEVRVVSNGVSKLYISEQEIQKKLNLIEDKQYTEILYLSNLIESKGYIELIEAVILLIEEGYSVKLTMAGAIFNKSEFEKIMKKVKEKKLENLIVYIGIVKDQKKKQILLSSDIMVLPTNYPIEAQPISIIEGMAAALPIISTNRGSIPDMIKDNGILIEKGERLIIFQSLKELMDNKKRIEFSKNSRKVFLKHFLSQDYIQKLKSVFQG